MVDGQLVLLVKQDVQSFDCIGQSQSGAWSLQMRGTGVADFKKDMMDILFEPYLYLSFLRGCVLWRFKGNFCECELLPRREFAAAVFYIPFGAYGQFVFPANVFYRYVVLQEFYLLFQADKFFLTVIQLVAQDIGIFL